MAESANSPTPTSPTSGVDLSSFAQTFKLGPLLGARALKNHLDLADQNARLTMAQAHGLPGDSMQKADDEVINVDSPTTTVMHNYPQPAAAAGALAKVALAFAVSGPIGAGIAAIPVLQNLLSKPAAVSSPATPVQPTAPSSPTVAPPSVNADQLLYDLRLGKPN